MKCRECGKDKPESDFYRRANGIGYRQPCRSCYSIAVGARYHAKKPDPSQRTASLAITLHRDGESATESIARALKVQFKSAASEMASIGDSIRVMVGRALGE